MWLVCEILRCIQLLYTEWYFKNPFENRQKVIVRHCYSPVAELSLPLALHRGRTRMHKELFINLSSTLYRARGREREFSESDWANITVINVHCQLQKQQVLHAQYFPDDQFAQNSCQISRKWTPLEPKKKSLLRKCVCLWEPGWKWLLCSVCLWLSP